MLPLLVAALGMWALSGRVDRLDAVPAAVVNLDEGAEVTDADGETQTVPFGRLLAGSLTQPGTVEGQDAPETTGFDWQLTSQEDAEEGLKDGSYSAVVVIPKDFSKHLATLGTPEASRAILEVTTNDASGQINALVGTAVAEASASTMGGQMAQQYLDQLYIGFNDLGDGFSDAADGAEELAGGTSDLAEGTSELAGGTRELADGTILLIMSTVGPAALDATATRLEGTGVRIVDAPVSGGAARAADGDLLVMVGGTESDVAAARPVLDALASNAPVVGPRPGDGQRFKIVN